MGQQPAQVGVPTPSTSAPHPGGSRPPQQVLNLQTYFPGMFRPQPSPRLAGKKMAVVPKIQMLPSQLSAAKRELPAKDHSQKRSKFREALAAALSVNSGHQFGLQSAGNASESPFGSAGGNKVASGNSSAAAALHDNILQNHGPSESMTQPNPKRARLSDVHAGVKRLPPIAVVTDETTEEEKARIHWAQHLAFIIEKRLFESFGGVSKQYQEKGLALLHKLKDSNNPVLRERVLSGDLTPDCLCAMTIDELDSKVLSERRMARAEERESIVVLPDREEDVTRLVRKSHKGESQVEVEETDVMEVGLGGGSLSNAQAESVDKKSVHKEVKESDDSVQDGVAEPCSSNKSSNLEYPANENLLIKKVYTRRSSNPSNLEYPANEKNVLMQEPMIDDVELTENLPQIMTLLEFMQVVLHSEPHSEGQSAGALQDDPSIDKADKALKSESFPMAKDKAAALKFQFHSDLRSPQDNFESNLESPINKSVPIMDPGLEPKEDVMANESDNSLQDGVAETCNSNTSSNLEHPTNEKNDLMQEPIIDDVELPENLPQIMTLLEFMQVVLHSEPNSEDQSVGALQDDPSIDKADKASRSESFPIAKDKAAALKFQFHSDLRSPQDNFESKLESPINKSIPIMVPVLEPKGDVIVKSPHKDVDAEKLDAVNGSILESTMHCKITPDAVVPGDSIWEGTIQLEGWTSPTNVVAIFKSGDKPCTNEWHRFLEIKRRVSLSDLKKYLEGLADSSKNIMVTEICTKEGSFESGRHHPLKIIDSHIANRRGVGLVEAAKGVKMYLCPEGEATKILADHLPKEHSGSLTVTETSIIGLVVWRMLPHVLSNVSPNRHDVPKNRATISNLAVPWISQPPSLSSNGCRSHQDVVTADGLPGFGPGVVKDDADLPASSATASQTNRSQWYTYLSEFEISELVQWYTSLSEFEIRELVGKYG